MPYLSISGQQIYYNDTGDGAPLVLLHNGFYSSATWDPVRAELAKTYRVIDYDRLGYGRSSHYTELPNEVDVIDAGVAELEAVLDSLSLDTVRIVGHCLGGAIALMFAAKYPRRVKRIVAASVGYFGSLRSLISTDMTFVPFERIDAALKRRMAAMHGKAYAETLWSFLRAYKRTYIMNEHYDIRKAVTRIERPLLIVNGDRDFYFEPAHPLSIYQKMRKTAALWIVPHTGHDVHMEKPSLFVDTVSQFLK